MSLRFRWGNSLLRLERHGRGSQPTRGQRSDLSIVQGIGVESLSGLPPGTELGIAKHGQDIVKQDVIVIPFKNRL